MWKRNIEVGNIGKTIFYSILLLLLLQVNTIPFSYANKVNLEWK